ncbi:MAG: carbohydrate binding domain-containing protein [Bacteroidota bacterium]
MKNVASLLFSLVLMVAGTGLYAQCPDTLINNGGFEEGLTDWWTWHGGDQASAAFSLSTDAFTGDSSAMISILKPADSIAGGAAEYNCRPQTIPVTGGKFYEITFAGKSTRAATEVRVNVKDENDSWFTVTNQTVLIDTVWAMYSVVYQADSDRGDVHLEFQVYNATFQSPYDVLLDSIGMCESVVLTNTCDENLITNPGFESGVNTDWWNWHSNNPTAYEFVTSGEAYLGDSSAMIRVLLPSDSISGPGEYNSRPQTAAIADSQNYKISLWGKSSVPNTTVSVWVKDENDGWTTIGNADLLLDTVWTEVSHVFTADKDRADVHLEIKVFNAGFQPYDVWLDEVSICPTEEDPGGGGGGEPQPPVYGSDSLTTSCLVNLAPGNDGFESPNDVTGWDIWDGSDSEELATINLDPILPYSGVNSARIDVFADNNTAEFHHRFGDRVTVEDGKEYTMTMWLRSDVPQGDTVDILARVVRDTDWEAQTFVNFRVTSNDWLNFNHTFTADGTWTNAFLEFKNTRWTSFTSAYSVWYDDVQLCLADSTTSTAIDQLEDLGLSFNLYPNPATRGFDVNLDIVSERFMEGAQMRLVDVVGRTIWTQTLDIRQGVQTQQIGTNNLKAGLYLLFIEHEGAAKFLKLQVQ